VGSSDAFVRSSREKTSRTLDEKPAISPSTVLSTALSLRVVREPRPLVTVDDALATLDALGAAPRLVTHGRLVAEAALELLAACRTLGLSVDESWVRAGAVLHDAGKIVHPTELDAPGALHEDAGEQLLLAHGVDARIARCCVSHAAWRRVPCSLEELLVALADALWKGVRRPELEAKVIDEIARQSAANRWSAFVDLDSCFERIADAGAERLLRSR
jgi:hypothetical protein